MGMRQDECTKLVEHEGDRQGVTLYSPPLAIIAVGRAAVNDARRSITKQHLDA